MYIYQAETYCDSCGADLKAAIDNSNEAVTLPEDSDHYPQWGSEEATDSPNHCASRDECLEAIDLTDYGLPRDATLFGSETRKIGAITNAGLTEYGEEYLKEMLAERDPTPYQIALHNLWKEVYSGIL